MPLYFPSGRMSTPPTGYWRVAPSFCLSTLMILVLSFNGAADGIVRNQTLNTLTLLPNNPLPSFATAVLMAFDCKITSLDVIDTSQEFNAKSYFDHAGISAVNNIAVVAFEYVSTMVGTWIGGEQQTMICPITGANGEITTSFSMSTAGSTSKVQGAQILGYYD